MASASTSSRVLQGMHTRERILEAARRVLAEGGSDRFTTRRVAQLAGVSHGMCHYHFRDKRDLILAVLVHARRAAVIDEEYRKRIFHVQAPQSFPTFLVDGRVAGTWRLRRAGDLLTVAVAPFRRLAPELLPGLRAETADVGRFLGAEATLTVEGP